MTCTTTCVQPSPSQCHCGACHITWSGITGFDQHRRDGQCLTPEAIGYTRDPRGVYRAPITDEQRQRLAALRGNAPSALLREPQTAEQPSAQGADGNGPETTTEPICDCGHDGLPPIFHFDCPVKRAYDARRREAAERARGGA